MKNTIGLHRELASILGAVQDTCIGLFKPRFSDKWELVVDFDLGILTCLSIGELFGLQELTIHHSEGRYVKFPEGKSMTKMMKDPQGFHSWYNENCK